MANLVFLALFFGLLEVFVSYAPLALMFGWQLLQSLDARYTQMYAVFAFSSVAALCSLGLIVIIGFEIFKKSVPISKIALFLKTVGLCFSIIGIYALFLKITAIDTNSFAEIGYVDQEFFSRLIFNSKYEICWIGMSAIVIYFLKSSRKFG